MSPHFGPVLFFLLAASASAQTQLGKDYASLRPQQKRLIDEFAVRFGRAINQKIDPAIAYDNAPESQRTTFDAVTHALWRTNLTGPKGEKLGTALDLVDSIDEVAGERRGEGGDRQFRIYFFLKAHAFEMLDKSREFKRGPDNSVFHRGYPICFRLDRTPSIQFSLSADHKRADIDVDYRSSKFPVGLINGHLTASNSDVRAGKNEARHNARWEGLIAWWTSLFPGNAETAAQSARETPGFPATPPKGKAKIEEAVDDFFHQWITAGNAPNAVSYFSRDSYACVAKSPTARNKRIEGGMVKVYLANQFAAYRKQHGTSDNIASVLKPVPAWSPDMKAVKQLSGDAYTLTTVPSTFVAAYDCDGDPSNNLGRGQAYMTALRYTPSGGKPQEFAFVWQKDGDYWRIVSAILLNADTRAKPLGEGLSRGGSAIKTIDVEGDPTLIQAATEFVDAWLVKRKPRVSLGYLLPEAYGCLEANSDTPVPPGVSLRRERMARNLSQVAATVGSPGSTLADLSQAPAPAQDGLRVVKHDNAGALLILQLSDQAASVMRCGARVTNDDFRNIGTERTFGSHYLSMFQLRTSGSPAVLVLAWKKDPKGWRVFFWQVETP